MIFHSRLLSSVAAVAITCAFSAAAYYYKSRNTEINEVMVFCKLQYNAFNCFEKLISYVEAAKKSISVCMPGIHNAAIQGRLVELIKTKNITVRIIIDQAGYNGYTEVFLTELIDAGAEIKYKTKEPTNELQHKFCLVDDKVLMTGTLNWGDDKSSDNWNYVYITSKPQLVEPVKSEFYSMWADFSRDPKGVGDLETVYEDISDSDTIEYSDIDNIHGVTNLLDNQITPVLSILSA